MESRKEKGRKKRRFRIRLEEIRVGRKGGKGETGKWKERRIRKKI